MSKPTVILNLLVLTFLSLNLKAEPYINGELRFPAQKLFNQDSGTFEIWFKQELKLDDEKYVIGLLSNRPICYFLKVSQKGLKNTKVKAKDNLDFIRFGMITDGNRFSLATAFNGKNSNVGKLLKLLNLDQDQWHYAAVTWEKTSSHKFKIVSYCNGVKLKETEFEYKNYGKLERDSVIHITDASSHNDKLDSGSLATIDSFRISEKSLSEKEIAKSFEKQTLTERKDTLLLEDFSKIKAPKKNNVDTLVETGKTAHKSSRRGVIYGPYSLVEGRNGGKAIKLFRAR
ncbi:MAG: LamG domain-containing protein [Lentisphaeraceae bacterium]|nr:LamG domain-containing protein [Lentisphaeraceae bacterium]